jgi:hypothetical protein
VDKPHNRQRQEKHARKTLAEASDRKRHARHSAGGSRLSPSVGSQVYSIAELKAFAQFIRGAAETNQAAGQRTIAVAQAPDGSLYAGSSYGFDAGQKAMAQLLGINLIPTDRRLHAEENLIKFLKGNFCTVGTYQQAPCGPDRHDCAGQLTRLGISGG